MGAVFQKDIYKPIPDGAELFTKRGKRFARWIGGRGNRSKKQTAEVRETKSGELRIVIQSKYYAKYRDGENIIRTVATGCKDETAARSVLADLERQAERVRSKVITAAEAAISKSADTPLSSHFDAYLTSLEANGRALRHRQNVRTALDRIAADCGFKTLADIGRDAFESWLVQREAKDMSARTRNLHRSAIVAFCNWCMKSKRLTSNPVAAIEKANEDADRRHQRRALTADELSRLFYAARLRPLAELGRETAKVKPHPDKPKKRANWRWVELNPTNIDAALSKARKRLAESPERIAELEATGTERALIYKTLALTGLRLGELASITVAQLYLDGPRPHIRLSAADAKSRKTADIPLRSDLAADLVGWIGSKLERLRDESRRRIDEDGAVTLPLKLPAATPLFEIPSGLSRIFNRDLDAAGVSKTDERGYVVDAHALRHTYCTMLGQSGAPLRTRQKLMRHSKSELTENVYDDLKLVDETAAVEALPSFPLRSSPNDEAQRATGTTGDVEQHETDRDKFAPMFAPTNGNQGVSKSNPDKPTDDRTDDAAVVNGRVGKGLGDADKGSQKAGERTRTVNVQLGRLMLYH